MLKTITAFAATLLAIVFVAESFVPNSAPVYGGNYVENKGMISYHADGCGVMGMEAESPNNYGVLLHEMSMANSPKLAGVKVKNLPVNDSNVAVTPDRKIPQPKKPVVNNSCNHQRRIIYHNGCNYRYHNGCNYYHTGSCGHTWRHVNYQRCQPIRNTGRFFYNVRPVRRAIGWVFCGRRCR